MRRREFITLLGGAAAWPVAAGAQQSPVRACGASACSATGDDAEGQNRLAAFTQALKQLGWSAGRNLRIDTRYATADNVHRRDGIGRARAGCPRRCYWHRNSGTVATGDSHRTDRVCECHRSGRRRIRRQPRPAGRQRDWLHRLRIRHQRKIAGTAQRDRAPRDAGGGASGPGHCLRDRTVRRCPGRGADVGGGVEPDRRARCRRNRARRLCIRALSEWWPDRDGQPVGGGSSRVDCKACGAAQATRSLLPTTLRQRRRPDFISGRIFSTSTGKPPATSTASSRARNRQTCRYRRRLSMS